MSPLSSVVRSTVASWSKTGTPSAVARTSTSTPSAPRATASISEASVFSGATLEAPRWAMMSGSPDKARGW
jgi:hypothetical protein